MPRFVLLLRGVNVGKSNRVPMEALRTLLEAVGCTGVRTLLNSGNAVFRSSARSASGLATAIGATLRENVGVDVLVVVKAASEFAAAVADNPFALPDAEHPRFLVAFAQAEGASQALSPLLPMLVPPERLHLGRHAAYLHCAAGILESKVGAALLGKTGRGITMRNWATVLKLDALLRDA